MGCTFLRKDWSTFTTVDAIVVVAAATADGYDFLIPFLAVGDCCEW